MTEPHARKPVVAAEGRSRVLLVGVPLAAGAAALYWYAAGGRHVETDNAYVKAHIIAVSAEVAGRVSRSAVRDNQPVAAGAAAVPHRSRRRSRWRSRAPTRRWRSCAPTSTSLRGRAPRRARRGRRSGGAHRLLSPASSSASERLKERGMSREDAVRRGAPQPRGGARATRRRCSERAARVLASLGGDPQTAGEPPSALPRGAGGPQRGGNSISRTRASAPPRRASSAT